MLQDLSWRPQQQHYVLCFEASVPVHSALWKLCRMFLELCLGPHSPHFEYEYPERKLQAKEIRKVFMERLFKSCCFVVCLHCRGNTEQMNYIESAFTFHLQYFYHHCLLENHIRCSRKETGRCYVSFYLNHRRYTAKLSELNCTMVAENCHAKNAVFAGIIFVIFIYFLF